uniref:Cysteine protease n=1 Tax=Periophthalmus magnuspinnatus TaxID=409849 RepID=A0A3B4B3V4_9GOBI
MENTLSMAECEDQPLAEEDPMDEWLFLSSESASPPILSVDRAEEPEDTRKLKSKLLSAWNSIKYVSAWSFKQKSKFNKSSPVIMLGKTYELTHSETVPEQFRRSFSSLLWLTYRRGFPLLPGSGLSTDSGWGCMLRTGQMLLAQGLLLHLMPPGQNINNNTTGLGLPTFTQNSKLGRQLSLGSLLDRPMEGTHRKVISWFADLPSAPFGIHTLVDLGKSSGKKAGDWYGPSIVAHILRKAVNKSPDVSRLSVYVAQDCTVYKKDVSSLYDIWTSVIILVPVRLGGQENCLACTVVLESLGGSRNNNLLYLDPHYCQTTVVVTKGNFPLESFHCKHPKKIPFSQMDPSCTVGFYAKDPNDFERLCKDVTEALLTSTDTYPMFIFEEGPGPQEETGSMSTNLTYIQRKSQRKRVSTTSSMDEFVLL